MIVSCTACPTRYLVDPALLGPDGRLVRCAKCGHKWTQRPPADMPRPVEPLPFEAAPFERVARTSRERAQVPALRRDRSAAAPLAWAVFAAVLVAITAAIVFMRESIVATWPAAGPLYAAIGLEAEPALAGLELRNVTSRETLADGAKILLVEGELANGSKKLREVPKLRGLLYDDRDREVQRWLFSAPERQLRPGQSVNFRTELRNPPASAVRLTIVLENGERR